MIRRVSTPQYLITLTESELIVLDGVLTRLSDRADFATIVPDAADRQAIDGLVAMLERQNPVVFAEDYDEALARARERVLPAD